MIVAIVAMPRKPGMIVAIMICAHFEAGSIV